MRLDITETHNEGIFLLKKWRERYPKAEYPFKIVQNIFYGQYGMNGIWESEIVSSFGKLRNTESNLNEAFLKIYFLYEQATSTLRPGDSLIDEMNKFESVGGLNYREFTPLIYKGKYGGNSTIEQLEFDYLCYFLSNITLMYLAAFGRLGYSITVSLKQILGTEFSSSPDLSYETLLHLIATCPSGVSNELSRCYVPLPNFFGEKESILLREIYQHEKITEGIKAIQSLRTPEEILYIFENIEKFSEAFFVDQKDFEHIGIYFTLAQCLRIEANKREGESKQIFDRISKKIFVKGVSVDYNYPSKYYNNCWADNIGQSFTYLLTKWEIEESEVVDKITALAYIYLSRAIELMPIGAFDSYFQRAILFMNHKKANSILRLRIEEPIFLKLFAISDLYNSYLNNSPYTSGEALALNLYHEIGNFPILGKIISDYSFDEIVEISKSLHIGLYKFLEGTYKTSKYNLTAESIANALL